MDNEQDKHSKTEAPTARRLEEAAKKGELAKSQDIPVWFISIGLIVLLVGAFEPFCAALLPVLRSFIERPHDFSVHDLVLLAPVAGRLLTLLFCVMALLCVAALAGHLAQHRPVWAVEKIKPSPEKLSPAKNISRVFGMSALVNLGKSILKLVAASAAVLFALWPRRDVIGSIGLVAPEAMSAIIAGIALRMFVAAAAGIGVVAVIDLIWQRHAFVSKMRMSRRDIKDETRQTEGDPQIKSRLREIRMQRARNRMMAAVPDASVVIANPTHYAVALQYDQASGDAPVCVARGVDELALRIRRVAVEHGVPVVENPSLARALHSGVELGEPIPVRYYQAVAGVIGFVMRTAAGNGERGNEVAM